MVDMMPAHVTAKKALGIADPHEAKEALVKAIQDKDNASLVKISSFWNTGFDYTSMPSDKDLYALQRCLPDEGLQGERVHDPGEEPGLQG